MTLAHRPVELSPAGAARERSVPCMACGKKTFNFGRVCGFCLPDAHEASDLTAEFMEEKS